MKSDSIHESGLSAWVSSVLKRKAVDLYIDITRILSEGINYRPNYKGRVHRGILGVGVVITACI